MALKVVNFHENQYLIQIQFVGQVGHTLFLKQRTNLRQENLRKRQRPLGLLDGKVKCRIHKDFAITDEEFLQS